MSNNRHCKDLTEQKFGHLVAKKIIGKDKRGAIWECLCDCGNITTANATRLNIGRKKSCGCRNRGSGHYMWSGYEGITGANWAHIKSHATNRNLPFEITIEYAWNLFNEQNCKCALSGELIYLAKNTNELLYQRKNTASLDRIDSKKGYIPGNVQWLHKDINIMKWDFNQSNFLYWCHKIADNNKDFIGELDDYYNSRWSNREQVANEMYDKKRNCVN